MAYTFDTAHARQFADSVILRAQQMGSRLRVTAGQTKTGVRGERTEFLPLAKSPAIKRTTAVAPTPAINLQWGARWAVKSIYDWATQIDRQSDVLAMLTDPESPAVKTAANALGRSIDDEIVLALYGTAVTGVNGSGSQVLPTAQKVAAASAGLTYAKLLAAIEILNAAECEDERYCLYGAAQQTDVLAITQMTSMDYRTSSAITTAVETGRPANLLGMTWIRSERLGVVGSDGRVLVFAAQGLGFGMWEDISVEVEKRADLNNAVQPMGTVSMGAVRIEDECVVEVACVE
jgi:hypothetical protein